MKPLDFRLNEVNHKVEEHGKWCWCIGLPDGREVDIIGDRVDVTGGVLTIWGHLKTGEEFPLMVLAPGAWANVYASSAWDSSPIAVSFLHPPSRER